MAAAPSFAASFARSTAMPVPGSLTWAMTGTRPFTCLMPKWTSPGLNGVMVVSLLKKLPAVRLGIHHAELFQLFAQKIDALLACCRQGRPDGSDRATH